MSKKQAMISVFDKEGIVDFAKGLKKLGIEIISSDGTATILQDAGIKVKEVSEVTDFPEMLDGRVKTLHPNIHAGILARRNKKSHMKTLKMHKIELIDIVVCNLYPFEETINKPDVSNKEVVENIDIGGDTLIRAAAKNHKDVIILTKPEQYKEILKVLKSGKDLSLKQRKRLAIEAFSHTAQYDAIISQYFRKKWTPDEIFPENQTITMRKIQDLRIGENPHQKAAFYKTLPLTNEPCVANAKQLQGKELSFNNILDSDCAIECVKEFPNQTLVIVKHITPCGIASAGNLLQAWKDAYATDKKSPFGGIVAVNREIDGILAEELFKYFLEIIIAPSFSYQSLLILGKKKNLRLLEVKGLDKVSARVNREGVDTRGVVGGHITQDRDVQPSERESWKFVTKKKPSPEDLESMEFAVKCVKHVKSNAVLFVKGKRTVAISGGQTSRVDATKIAIRRGGGNRKIIGRRKNKIKGSIMASDAFFPFPDCVKLAGKAGVKGIIQPGGSRRDKEVITEAIKRKIIMVLSSQRYFRH